MADLSFATKGQAEALAAQEAVRQKALDTRQEFEAGAKAAGAWDAALGKLKTQGESALKSIATEQEKIVDKINAIKAAQEEGFIPPAEAEEAIRRLRQEWINVDEATQAAGASTDTTKDKTAALSEEHVRLKSTAESALRSIQTEEEQILEQIEAIESAMSHGLVPPEEAQAGIAKLKERLGEVKDAAAAAGAGALQSLKNAFSPMHIVKIGLSVVGMKAAVAQIKQELRDVQDGVDRRSIEDDEIGGELEKKLAATYGEDAAKAGLDDQSIRNALSPEEYVDFQRYRSRKRLSGDMQNTYRDIIRATPNSMLSTKELTDLEDVLREAGQGELLRQVMKFRNRLDDGSIDRGEVAEDLNNVASDFRSYKPQWGPDAPRIEPLTAQEELIARALERLGGDLGRGQRESDDLQRQTNRLLEQILQKDGSIMMTAE
jgi:hypothetical protein